MCLIVYKPVGKEVPDYIIRSALLQNDDGVGFMFNDPLKKSHIEIDKQIGKAATFSWVSDFLKANIHKEVGLHFRMRTHGAIDLAMCHPYKILSQEEDGFDMYLMHNGILSNMPLSDTTKSDTWHFINLVLRPLMKSNPDLLKDIGFTNWLGGAIGGGNKFLILDSRDGMYYIINRAAGTVHKDLWLSNTYAWTEPNTYSYKNRYNYYGDGDAAWGEYYESRRPYEPLLPGARNFGKSITKTRYIVATGMREDTYNDGSVRMVVVGVRPEGEFKLLESGKQRVKMDNEIVQGVEVKQESVSLLMPLKDSHPHSYDVERYLKEVSNTPLDPTISGNEVSLDFLLLADVKDIEEIVQENAEGLIVAINKIIQHKNDLHELTPF